jgi:hypothetical protein
MNLLASTKVMLKKMKLESNFYLWSTDEQFEKRWSEVFQQPRQKLHVNNVTSIPNIIICRQLIMEKSPKDEGIRWRYNFV